MTAKQEAFALGLFKGLTNREAYRQAGYSMRGTENRVDVDASRLASSPKVFLRLSQLREAVASASIADVTERKEILSEIARAKLVDFQCAGPDGDQINVGPESPNSRALAEITSKTEYSKTEGREEIDAAVITKLKLHNPVQAIAELNKMENSYATPEMTVNHRILRYEVVRSG